MSKIVVFLLFLVFVTATCLVSIQPINAAKTIVVPDDYSTISSAIGNARDGDTIIVKKGTYEEKTLEINKALSLVGEDANNTTINLHPPYNETWILTQPFRTYSKAITIDEEGVKISNFTITITPGGDIAVNSDETQITGNNITIEDESGVSGLRVKSSFNIITGNSFWVIFLDNANSNTVSNNTCGEIKLGFANQTSSYNVISRNKIEAGTRGLYGIEIRSGSNNVFYDNNISNCLGPIYTGGYKGYGVAFTGELGEIAQNNTFYHNNFVNNNKHVDIYKADSVIGNFWDNGEEGNYWDDYNGTDSNRDGIGDTPYVINSDNIDNYPLIAPFNIENDTVVLPPPEPFPTTLVAAASIALAVAVGGLLIYFKKRKH